MADVRESIRATQAQVRENARTHPHKQTNEGANKQPSKQTKNHKHLHRVLFNACQGLFPALRKLAYQHYMPKSQPVVRLLAELHARQGGQMQSRLGIGCYEEYGHGSKAQSYPQ